MAPGHVQTPYAQPRPTHTSQQTTPHQYSACYNPYITAPGVYQSAPVSNRQLTADTGARSSYSMANFSTMTSSALFDALLTPSSIEQEHEQERDPQAFSFSNVLPELSPLGAKSCCPLDDRADEPADHSDRHCNNSTSGFTKAVIGKRSDKRQRRMSSESDGDYVAGAYSGSVNSPRPAREPRRSSRAKKSTHLAGFPSLDDAHNDYDNNECNNFVTPQKRPKKASARKVSQARPGRLVRKKPNGRPVPKTLREAGPEDRMMWEWKNQGKNWEEIRAEWKRLTGIEPGGSSLSVRYIKLVENLARNGAAGDIELLRFKREAEEDLLSGLWSKVAEKMVAYSPESEHNPKDLQKRYNMIVRSGYDIERILAEDEARRVEEQDHLSIATRNDHPAPDSDIDAEQAVYYDNEVARQTLALARGHDSVIDDESEAYQRFGTQLMTTPESQNPVPDYSLPYHDTSSSNDQKHYEITRAEMSGHYSMESVMSGPTLLPTSPPAAQKRELSRFPGSCLPQTGPLVDYDSDSE